MSISRLTMSQQIYEQIRKDIISGRYQPGDQLKEVWIAKALEVSPTPVREAFKQLEAEGFLESIPYKGVFVKSYGKDDYRMAYLIRSRMESLALRFIMEKITQEESDKLEAIMEEAESDLTGHPFRRFYKFHDWIIRNTRTDIIIKTLSSINGVINIDILMRDLNKVDEERYVQNHLHLFQLIRSKDVGGAERQLENMIIQQMRDLIH